MKTIDQKLNKGYFRQVERKRRKSHILSSKLETEYGDILQLREVDKSGNYTNRAAITKVTQVLTHKDVDGLKKGYYLVSFELQNIIEIVQGTPGTRWADVISKPTHRVY